ELRVPASLEPILRYLSPGNDSFPEEKDAEEIAERLGELSLSLRQDRGAECLDRLLAPEFRGGRLLPAEAIPVSSQAAFSVLRAKTMSKQLTRDRGSFREELRAFAAPLGSIRVAEFLITAIEKKQSEAPWVQTDVRYDLVGNAAGEGAESGRAERVGA